MTIPDRTLHDLVIRVRALERRITDLETSALNQAQTLGLVINNVVDHMVTEDGDWFYTEGVGANQLICVEAATVLEGHQLDVLTDEIGQTLFGEDWTELAAEESLIAGDAETGYSVYGTLSGVRDEITGGAAA